MLLEFRIPLYLVQALGVRMRAVLLEAGARTDLKNLRGQTALDFAQDCWFQCGTFLGFRIYGLGPHLGCIGFPCRTLLSFSCFGSFVKHETVLLP